MTNTLEATAPKQKREGHFGAFLHATLDAVMALGDDEANLKLVYDTFKELVATSELDASTGILTTYSTMQPPKKSSIIMPGVN